jgi:hypothetical protein
MALWSLHLQQNRSRLEQYPFVEGVLEGRWPAVEECLFKAPVPEHVTLRTVCLLLAAAWQKNGDEATMLSAEQAAHRSVRIRWVSREADLRSKPNSRETRASPSEC